MKKLSTVFILTTLVLAVIVMSCNTTPATDWTAVAGKEWRLIEVHISDTFDREVLFNRNDLSRDSNTRDVFTLKFENDLVSGTGAPNRFNAPFTLGEQAQSIRIMPARSTQMAPIFQPARLREHDFFMFLNNVYKWELDERLLVLRSKAQDDRDVVMIFQ